MAISIEEAKAFIADATKARERWLSTAERSWNEIKKQRPGGGQFSLAYSVNPNSVQRRGRYPAWYSILKIRQPLLLARLGVPVAKDTTQDGNDGIGSVAAVCLERLATNLGRSFDMFDVMAACRDDFLITNFAECRGYYERDEIKQKVKEYVTPEQVDEDVVFIDGAGKVIESDNILEDDEGYFIELNQVVDVENERLCLKPVLYKHFYVEPDVTQWEDVERVAYELHFSEPRFKQVFGLEAFNNLPSDATKDVGASEAAPKRRTIKVFEYWDKYEKDVYWWTELGEDFIKPVGYALPIEAEDEDETEQGNGLYNLLNLFPCPKPMIINAPTDEYFPVTEFEQIQELILDIHMIFSRMMTITRAIRPRLLFDNNVEGLQEALNEAATSDAFGVPNLAQSLASAGGTIENVVAYIPVEKMVAALEQMYIALEQRLQALFKLTGTSDILQGLTTQNTDKTLGERQMEEKYAINQIAEFQRKMQEFVRDSFVLLAEMALKNFKDASLDRYIMPETLTGDQQSRYRAAIGLLKSDLKRFRLELETDSTMALNEEYNKRMAIELVNALTTALEKTANIAETSPALVVTELHCLKYLIQQFRQGKLFQNEVTQAIDNVIKMAEGAKAPPFNKDQAAAEIEMRKLAQARELKMMDVGSYERVELAKLQAGGQKAMLEANTENTRTQSAMIKEQGALRLEYDKINAAIMTAREALQVKREQMMLDVQSITDESERERMSLAIDAEFRAREAELDEQRLMIEQQYGELDMQERYMTEQRLQAEHSLKELEAQMAVARTMKELEAPPDEAPLNLTIQQAPPAARKQKLKVVKDKFGQVKKLEASDETKPAETT